MRKDAGLTIIELIVVMGIIMTLFVIGSITFIKPQQKANIDAVVNTLIADIKSEQTKAMAGDLSSNFTILFESKSYNIGDYKVSLPESIEIKNITFVDNKLIFQKGSGEFNYSGNQNSLVVSTETGDEPVQIIINKYGAVQKSQ